MIYERKYVGENDWEQISEKEFIHRLHAYYRKVKPMIPDMLKSGMPLRTPNALYRVREDPKEVAQA